MGGAATPLAPALQHDDEAGHDDDDDDGGDDKQDDDKCLPHWSVGGDQ